MAATSTEGDIQNSDGDVTFISVEEFDQEMKKSRKKRKKLKPFSPGDKTSGQTKRRRLPNLEELLRPKEESTYLIHSLSKHSVIMLSNFYFSSK